MHITSWAPKENKIEQGESAVQSEQEGPWADTYKEAPSRERGERPKQGGVKVRRVREKQLVLILQGSQTLKQVRGEQRGAFGVLVIERSTVGSGLVTNGLSKTQQAEGGDRKGGSRSTGRSGQDCNPWRAHQSSANLVYSQRTQFPTSGLARELRVVGMERL